jgi:hypothetical protein
MLTIYIRDYKLFKKVLSEMTLHKMTLHKMGTRKMFMKKRKVKEKRGFLRARRALWVMAVGPKNWSRYFCRTLSGFFLPSPKL